MVVSILAFVLTTASGRAFADDERTFGGYDCTVDCSGHKAGYDWTEEKDISDESNCGGNSQSFIEGCQAYVQDPSRGSEEDDQGNSIE